MWYSLSLYKLLAKVAFGQYTKDFLHIQQAEAAPMCA